MEWYFVRYPEQGFVENVCKGEINARDLREDISEAIRIEKEEGLIRFLSNVTELIIPPEFSFFDILAMPADQWVKEEADRDARVAVLSSGHPSQREAVQFYETAAMNRGWNVKAFIDREEAIAWLLVDTHDNRP